MAVMRSEALRTIDDMAGDVVGDVVGDVAGASRGYFDAHADFAALLRHRILGAPEPPGAAGGVALWLVLTHSSMSHLELAPLQARSHPPASPDLIMPPSQKTRI